MERESDFLVDRRALLRALGVGGGVYGLTNGGVIGAANHASPGTATASGPGFETLDAGDIIDSMVDAAREFLIDLKNEITSMDARDAVNGIGSALSEMTNSAIDAVDFGVIQSLLEKARILLDYGDTLTDSIPEIEDALDDDDDDEDTSDDDDSDDTDDGDSSLIPWWKATAGTPAAGANAVGATTPTSASDGGYADTIRDGLGDLADDISELADEVTDVIGETGMGRIEDAWGGLGDFIDEVRSIDSYIKDAAEYLIDILVEPIRNAKEYVEDLLSDPTENIPTFELDMSPYGIDLTPRVSVPFDSVGPDRFDSMSGTPVGAGATSSAHARRPFVRTNLEDQDLEEFLDENDIVLNEDVAEFLDDDGTIVPTEDLQDFLAENDIETGDDLEEFLRENDIESGEDLEKLLTEHDIVLGDELEEYLAKAGVEIGPMGWQDCEKAVRDRVYAVPAQMEVTSDVSAEAFVGIDPFRPNCIYHAVDPNFEITVDGERLYGWMVKYQTKWQEIGEAIDEDVDDPIHAFESRETFGDLETALTEVEEFRGQFADYVGPQFDVEHLYEWFDDLDIDEFDETIDKLDRDLETMAEQLESAAELIGDGLSDSLELYADAITAVDLEDDIPEREALADRVGDLASEPAEDIEIETPEKVVEHGTDLVEFIREDLDDSDKKLIEKRTNGKLDLDQLADDLEPLTKESFDAAEAIDERVTTIVDDYLKKIEEKASEMIAFSYDLGSNLPDFECKRDCNQPNNTKPTAQPVFETLYETVEEESESSDGEPDGDSDGLWDTIQDYFWYIIGGIVLILLAILAAIVIGIPATVGSGAVAGAAVVGIFFMGIVVGFANIVDKIWPFQRRVM